MDHKLTITLPDDVFQSLVEMATKHGLTPEEMVVELIAHSLGLIKGPNGWQRSGDASTATTSTMP